MQKQAVVDWLVLIESVRDRLEDLSRHTVDQHVTLHWTELHGQALILDDALRAARGEKPKDDGTTTLSCGCVIDENQLLISCSAEHAPDYDPRANT